MIAWESTGEGPPVVLVHGLSEDRRGWDPLVPLLAVDRRVVRLDLRCHGESPDASPGDAVSMAADVAEVVAAAGIVEPPVVVGHSLGAVVATAYALSAPVKAVVNVDQSLRLGDFAAALAPLEAGLRDPATFADTFVAVLEALGHEGLSPQDTEYVLERHRTARQDVVLGVWDLVFATSPDDLTAMGEGMLAGLTVPYVAIHGSDPGEGYAEWLAAHVPTARLEVWRGGHYPHLVEPERFARRVRELAG